MKEAVRVAVRYDVPRDFGGPHPETRREYNLRFGQSPGPESEIPYQVEHVWEWFWRISNQRGHADGSPMPISYSEIESWSRVTGNAISPYEVGIIIGMDQQFRSTQADEQKDERDRRDRKNKAPKASRTRRR